MCHAILSPICEETSSFRQLQMLIVSHMPCLQNILLGLGGRAKLADVGLAQLLDGSQPAQSEVHFVGTLPWAAPETLEGAPLTTKADIYSLGVLLWEVVTHEAPCRGFMRDPVVPEECPEEVAAAIQACMQVGAAAENCGSPVLGVEQPRQCLIMLPRQGP